MLQSLMQEEFPKGKYRTIHELLNVIIFSFHQLQAAHTPENQALFPKLLGDVKDAMALEGTGLDKMAALVRKLECDPVYKNNDIIRQLAESIHQSDYVMSIAPDLPKYPEITGFARKETKHLKQKLLSLGLSGLSMLGYGGYTIKAGHDIRVAARESAAIVQELKPKITGVEKILVEKTTVSPVSTNIDDHPVQYLLRKLEDLRDGIIEPTSPLTDDDKKLLDEHIENLRDYQYHEARSLRSSTGMTALGIAYSLLGVMSGAATVMGAGAVLKLKAHNDGIQKHVDDSICAALDALHSLYHQQFAEKENAAQPEPQRE